MTINELIKKLNKIEDEHKDKEISIVTELHVGVYLCTKEGDNKVRPLVELQDLTPKKDRKKIK